MVDRSKDRETEAEIGIHSLLPWNSLIDLLEIPPIRDPITSKGIMGSEANFKYFFYLHVCLKEFMSSRCMQVPEEARRGHEISWNWFSRQL